MNRSVIFGALAGVVLGLLACQPDESVVYSGQPPKAYRNDVGYGVMAVSDVSKACLIAGLEDIPDTIVNACTVSRGNNHVVIMPNPCAPRWANDEFARHLCHEQGHVNGWPGNHPR